MCMWHKRGARNFGDLGELSVCADCADTYEQMLLCVVTLLCESVTDRYDTELSNSGEFFCAVSY